MIFLKHRFINNSVFLAILGIVISLVILVTIFKFTECPERVEDSHKAALEYVQNPIDCDAKALDGEVCAAISDMSHSARIIYTYEVKSSTGKTKGTKGHIVIISGGTGKKPVAIYVGTRNCGYIVDAVKMKPRSLSDRGNIECGFDKKYCESFLYMTFMGIVFPIGFMAFIVCMPAVIMMIARFIKKIRCKEKGVIARGSIILGMLLLWIFIILISIIFPAIWDKTYSPFSLILPAIWAVIIGIIISILFKTALKFQGWHSILLIAVIILCMIFGLGYPLNLVVVPGIVAYRSGAYFIHELVGFFYKIFQNLRGKS